MRGFGGGGGALCRGLQMDFEILSAGPIVLGHRFQKPYGSCFCDLLGSLGGVALSKLGFMGEIALTIAAILVSLSLWHLLFSFPKSKGQCYLLIIGVMIGYIANAVIGVLKFWGWRSVHSYVIWGLGSFPSADMTLFICIMVVLLPLSFLLSKH